MEDTILNVWVGNLGKYNEGELVGAWLELPKTDEEIDEFLKEKVGISSEPDAHGVYYEEWAIMDWESPYWDRISEYDNLKALNEEAQRIEDMSEGERKLMLAGLEILGDEIHQLEPDDMYLTEGIENHYDLGWYYAHELYGMELEEDSVWTRFFDYEAYGRYLDDGNTGGFTKYGYLEVVR